VHRPVWEDPLNLPGGKWIIRLRKGVADRLWEDLVLAIIGDRFAYYSSDTIEDAPGKANEAERWRGGEKDGKEADDWPEICGCTISVRQSEDIVSVWNRVDDLKVRERIR
jgi:translation initiation factor 4E